MKLEDWLGKTEEHEDVISEWKVNAAAAMLDTGETFKAGDALPPGWHWMFFLEAAPASKIGEDGHPQRGGFLPPVPLPRRMWAGGRVEFAEPVRIGERYSRRSTIKKIAEKSGATGSLVFVTVEHIVHANGRQAIVEEQDLVYREAAKPGAPAAAGKAAPSSATWTRSVHANTVLLFRFSALTFNGHRIHYDRDYAINGEHYPGLVVHGPLQSTLILELCRKHGKRPVKRLEYRATSPLFEGHTFSVNGEVAADQSGAQLWTADHNNNMGMQATASF